MALTPPLCNELPDTEEPDVTEEPFLTRKAYVPTAPNVVGCVYRLAAVIKPLLFVS
jgi:hypothetical protein